MKRSFRFAGAFARIGPAMRIAPIPNAKAMLIHKKIGCSYRCLTRGSAMPRAAAARARRIKSTIDDVSERFCFTGTESPDGTFSSFSDLLSKSKEVTEFPKSVVAG
jgi:hypothetical protein